MLTLEKCRLVNHEHVTDEFAVKRLEAIAVIYVIWVHGSESTAGLNDRHGAQSLAIGKILLQS